MIFYSSISPDPVVNYLTNVLKEALQAGKTIAWFIPGGSAIEVAVAVARALKDEDTSNLTVTLTDERYGPLGHPDENWSQLLKAGFALPGATLLPVLIGQTAEATTTQYSSNLEKLLRADYCLGFFGLGADGHTAGILPHSPVVTSEEYAAYYQSKPFYRITMTPRAIAKLDEAVVYARGTEKRPALEHLREVLPLADQPAQALKIVKKLTIFNDQIGDSV